MPNQTGPKTAEGKLKATHGLHCERMFVLSNETPENWDQMLDEWTRKLRPRDEAERMIVVSSL